ncbi:MAG: hypothetical protein E7058_00630 [Lentisphaerae bacterium]|nr:hypothetical protein [Lentisphaerota bacterium]
METPRVIDTHCHLWMGDDTKYLDQIAEDGIIEQAWILAHECHVVSDTYRSATKAQVLEAARRYPGFILPFGYIDWRQDASQIDILKEQGFFGLKAIRPIYNYDDERYYPIYKRAEELDMPIEFHVGIIANRPLDVLTDPRFSPGPIRMRPSMLDTIAAVCPKLRLIQGHMGVPWCNELFESLWYYPNIYAGISGLTDWEWLIKNLSRKACDQTPFHQKIMFATDSYYGEVPPELFYRRVYFINDFFRFVGETYDWGSHREDVMRNNAIRFRDGNICKR